MYLVMKASSIFGQKKIMFEIKEANKPFLKQEWSRITLTNVVAVFTVSNEGLLLKLLLF